MTLFAEIAGRETSSGAPRDPHEREAVARDIERICATRRLSLLLAPEYGIDDATALFHDFPEIGAWAARLERTLAVYAPRLGRPDVHPADADPQEGDLTFRAEIRGVLQIAGKATDARFTATLDAQRRLRVR